MLLAFFLLISMTTIPSHAAASLIPITGAVLNDQLNFKLDGITVTPVGDDGTPVLPISYNGTTYLPVRAIGYLLGLGIDYESTSKTVLISSSTTKAQPMAVAATKSNKLIPITNVVLNAQLQFKLDNTSVTPVGDDGTPVLPISYNGTTYLPVRAIGYLLGLGIDYEASTKTVLIVAGGGSTAQKSQVWKLKTTDFVDGSGRTDSVLMGTSSGLYDITSYEGTPTDLTITHNRYDTKSGALLAGVTYRCVHSVPAEYLIPGETYSIQYKLVTIDSTTWLPPQQTLYLDQGMGVYFANSAGVQYISSDIDDTFTITKPIEKGSSGRTRQIKITNGSGFYTTYTYEWIN